MLKICTLAACLFLTCAVYVADACSCAPLPIATYFELADVAWEGRVLARETVMYKVREDDEAEEFEVYTIAVQHLLKGNVAEKTVHVVSPTYSSCGISFNLDQEYMFFAREVLRFEGEENLPVPMLITDLCSGNRSIP